MTYYFIMPEDRWHLELVIRQLKNFIIFPKMPNESFELNPSFSALREAHGGNSVINNYFVLLSLMRLPFHSSHDTLGIPRHTKFRNTRQKHGKSVVGDNRPPVLFSFAKSLSRAGDFLLRLIAGFQHLRYYYIRLFFWWQMRIFWGTTAVDFFTPCPDFGGQLGGK